MRTAKVFGTVNLPERYFLKKVAPVVVSLAVSVSLSACGFIDQFSEQNQTSIVVEKTRPYFFEASTKSGRMRVMSPDALIHVSGTTTQAVPNRDQEARESVKSDYPTTYTVQKGDTLWDISAMFLSKPWLWPEIWEVNPQIQNPHLIYPGDQVALSYVDGVAKMVVSRNGAVVDTLNRRNTEQELLANGTTNMRSKHGGILRLSPQIREEPLETAIPTIPGDAIQQFLVYPHVAEESIVTDAPYVLGNFEGRLASATGHQIYVRGGINKNQSQYGIFRKNQVLSDPDTGETLGFELTHVADSKLLHSGDPATMLITSSKLETNAGDRLLPQNQSIAVHNYVPRVPLVEGEGKIISLFNAISQSGRNQVVVVNMGKREGVRIGDVMAIEHRGGVLKDRYSGKKHDYIKVPNTRIGVMMIFHTFEKVSYGLIMESTRPIHKHDAVTGI